MLNQLWKIVLVKKNKIHCNWLSLDYFITIRELLSKNLFQNYKSKKPMGKKKG